MGSLFQTRHAVDEKDFQVAIEVFLNDADMVIEEEDWSDREGVYQAARSGMYKISAGVPQGSCLRYLLFCVYTSNLANVILEIESFHQYADYTQLVCGISTGNSI